MLDKFIEESSAVLKNTDSTSLTIFFHYFRQHFEHLPRDYLIDMLKVIESNKNRAFAELFGESEVESQINFKNVSQIF